MDHGNAGVQRLPGALKIHLAAVQHYLALSGGVYARQYFDKGGFARAVFSQKSMNLARVKVDGYVIQGENARKFLGYVYCLNTRFHVLSSL